MSNISQTTRGTQQTDATKSPWTQEDAFKWVDRILTFVKESIDQALRREELLVRANEQHLRHEGLREWGTTAQRRTYVQSPQTRSVPRTRGPRELN